MMRLLESHSISTGGQRGYHILWHLSQSGTLCLGPLEGKQQTFVLLSEWAPKPRKLDRPEALAELAERYFTSHGPATISDFATWTKLPLGEIKQGFEANKNYLVSEKIDGVEYWRSSKPSSKEPNDSVLLLPGFEEFIIGYKDRSAVIDPKLAANLTPTKNGILHPIMVKDGRVIGTWRRTIKPKKIDITLLPFEPLDIKTKDQAAQAAEIYSAFMGLPIGALASN
jgi:hypothetical protein